MRKIHLLFSLIFLLALNCSPEEEKGLFPGFQITGNAFTDALLLGVLATPPCQFLTNENANSSFVLGEGLTSICSAQLVQGTIQVIKTGTYEISAIPGKQTLTASRCNSMHFDFHISLREGNSEILSSSGTASTQFVLEAGKQYSLVPTGLVDPNVYQCQGRTVTSSVVPYRIQFQKR